MNKKEACNRLADINEKITEIEDILSDIEGRLIWDDENRKEYYLARKAKLSAELDDYICKRDEFISKYYDIIYS